MLSECEHWAILTPNWGLPFASPSTWRQGWCICRSGWSLSLCHPLVCCPRCLTTFFACKNFVWYLSYRFLNPCFSVEHQRRCLSAFRSLSLGRGYAGFGARSRIESTRLEPSQGSPRWWSKWGGASPYSTISSTCPSGSLTRLVIHGWKYSCMVLPKALGSASNHQGSWWLVYKLNLAASGWMMGSLRW